MATMTMKFIRPKRGFANAKRLRAEVDAVLEKEVAQHYLKTFRKHVADWTHKPAWQSRFTASARASKLTVYPTGRNVKLWKWTSRGTRAHRIAARRARTLAFQTNYSARTQPVGRYGVGTGKSSGPWRYPLAVAHPGTKARLFEETVMKKHNPWFFKTMRTAIKRGMRSM